MSAKAEIQNNQTNKSSKYDSKYQHGWTLKKF